MLHLQVIWQQISAILPTDDKVTQVSIATLVLNYAVSATSGQGDQKASNKIQGEVSWTRRDKFNQFCPPLDEN